VPEAGSMLLTKLISMGKWSLPNGSSPTHHENLQVPGLTNVISGQLTYPALAETLVPLPSLSIIKLERSRKSLKEVLAWLSLVESRVLGVQISRNYNGAKGSNRRESMKQSCPIMQSELDFRRSIYRHYQNSVQIMRFNRN